MKQEANIPVLNPDSVIVNQMEGHWQKLLMLVIWKLSPDKPVRITSEDMLAVESYFAPSIPHIFTHGTHDAIELSLVTEEQAHKIVAHDAKLKGTA
jgi:hypothetical protein